MSGAAASWAAGLRGYSSDEKPSSRRSRDRSPHNKGWNASTHVDWDELDEEERKEDEKARREKSEEREGSRSRSSDRDAKPRRAEEDVKKPSGTYKWFCKEVEPIVQKEMPDLTETQVNAELYRLWKEVYNSEEDRARFHQLAKAERSEYLQHTASWKEDDPVDDDADAKDDPDAPKKPVGAYLWFCKEHGPVVKKNHPEYTDTELSAELYMIWKDLYNSDEERARFNRLAEEDRVRYLEAMDEYEKTRTDDLENEDDQLKEIIRTRFLPAYSDSRRGSKRQ